MNLLQGAPSRPFRRWLCLLPMALLLGSSLGLQAAPQAPSEPSSALMRWWRSLARHQVQVQTDDQGTLITESGWGGRDRTYQIAKDAKGQTHESYRERGQVKPVDEAVRHWAEAMIREAQQVPTIQPLPPLPPVSSVPPAPPVPHAFAPGEAGQEALRSVQNDARLIAMVGTPITMDANAKGSLKTWAQGEPHGLHLFSPTGGAKANLTLFVYGPKGGALLHVEGERTGTEWTFSKLEAQSSQGGPVLNLLSK